MEKLTLTDLAPSLLALVKSAAAPAEVRAAALRTLHHSSFIPHTSSLAAEALKLALTDKSETLRKEASRLSAAGGGADAIARLSATLQTGTLGERQSALQSLACLKGKEADDALRKALTQLLEGKLAKELHLDVLEAAAKRTSPSIKERLAQFEAKRDAKDPLAKWRECLTGGDAKAGRVLSTSGRKPPARAATSSPAWAAMSAPTSPGSRPSAVASMCSKASSCRTASSRRASSPCWW